jgi:ABC-type Co2+ transport system permease subunit
MLLSYGTAAAVVGVAAKLAWDNIKDNGAFSFLIKTLLASIVVFCRFEVLPHYPIGVSEVHLILGTTIFMMFGIAPAAIGLALGLLSQGLFFAPFDLPQYGINVTTLLASILVLNAAAKRIIPAHTAYKDLSYGQMLRMSVVWEGSVVAWVAFWAFYGQGFGSENLSNVFTFGSAYMTVILLEPLIDLGILAIVKAWSRQGGVSTLFFDRRLNNCQPVVS